MAFSVVSTIDGSMFGSLSVSKRRSPGSNRAEGKEKTTKLNHVKNTVCSAYSGAAAEKSYPPPPSIFSSQEVNNHNVRAKPKVSFAAK